MKSPETVERERARRRAWKLANPEKLKAQEARYRERHKEVLAEKRQKWQQENRELCVHLSAKWAAANPQRVLENKRNYARKHPDRILLYKRRHLIKKHGFSRTAERRLMDRVYACVPRTLPRDVRDDIVGMMFEAIYSGRFPRRVGPEHAKSLITEHFRQFSKFDTVSLDYVVCDGATRGQLMGIY